MYMHIHPFAQQLFTVRTGTVSVFGIFVSPKASCIDRYLNKYKQQFNFF